MLPLGGTIVKKIISLVLALTLLVGMLGVSAVALAEETTPTVTANQDKIDAFIAADNGTVDKRGLSVLSKTRFIFNTSSPASIPEISQMQTMPKQARK